jgi:cysteine desulfurase family protein (TIGR01976 family)
MIAISPCTVPSLNLDFVRGHFPSLAGQWIFLDNAGGSQVLKTVGDRIADFLYHSNVQLGASYDISQVATERVTQGSAAVATFINAAETGEVILGSSTSALLRMLAHCLGQTLRPGDEIIVTNCDHEANVTPWVELQRHGVILKVWSVNPISYELDLTDLEALLSDRTRLVAVTHTSNILGTLNAIRTIADRVHAQGAWLCVDGVALAPHRRIDVQALDIDFYAFSLYKVYGPHLAVLYGKAEHLRSLPSYNHFFIGPESLPAKFQPGGSSYELTYSLTAIPDYFQALAQHHWGEHLAPTVSGQIDQAFDLIRRHEAALSDRLLTFLQSKPRAQIIGHPDSDPAKRVPIISFVVEGVDSSHIPPQVDPHQIGIRYGHFYAVRLVEALGLAAQNGVVRVSFVHYNTLAECDRLIAILDPLL